MEAAGPSLPEFQPFYLDLIAAPVWWPWNRARRGIKALNGFEAGFQEGAVRHGLALRRSGCPYLTLVRPADKIGIAFFRRGGGGYPLKPHLPL